MIKNLILDFGGVLVGLDKRRCTDAFVRIGAGAIAGYVDECRQEDLFHELEVGAIGVAGFCSKVRQACPGCTATDAEICGAWNALLTGIPRRKLDFVAKLKEKYRIVLLSNTNPIHWQKSVADYFTIAGKSVDWYFERTFLSYEMHMLKPDEALFRRVLNDMDFNAAETLFVDDSEKNCRAAERVGMRKLKFKN